MAKCSLFWRGMSLELNFDLMHKWLELGAFLRVSKDELYLYDFSSPKKPIQDENSTNEFVSEFASEFIVRKFFAHHSQKWPVQIHKFKVSEFIANLESLIEPATWGLPAQSPEQKDFFSAFEQIQAKFKSGELSKVVPIVFSNWFDTPSFSDKVNWLKQVLQAPTSLYPFGFWHEEQGILGATPEILFSLQGRTLKTMALAGTLPKSQGTASDLENNSKEQYEHRLVVEDIEKTLAAYGKLKISKTQVTELPTLYHLQTLIELEALEAYPAEKWLELLHPTPALGVAPRSADYRWMQNLPFQKSREYYGSPLYFPLSKNEGICLVAIRALEWYDGKTFLNAGCGIVPESQPEKEWQELLAKQNSVLKIMGIL